MKNADIANKYIRYEVDEKPPLKLSVLLAGQIVLLIVAGIVLTPAIVLRGAGMPPGMEGGVIFFALLISGFFTFVQAKKIWRFGAGYILLMGTSGAFIAVGISALNEGGMPLLMTLIVASSLIQFVFASKLGLMRHLVTPLVGGTTIMLLAVTVMPVGFKLVNKEAVSGNLYENPVIAIATLATIILVSFFGSRNLRLWAPVIGIAAGTVVSLIFSDFDSTRIENAAWLGIPDIDWQGFDLSFGAGFWSLLPAFIVVTIVGALETYGDAVAVQRISHRKRKAINFKSVQGALYADGMGNLISGVAGTMPNTTYSTSISVVDMTGVGAKSVGIWCGIIMMLLAFAPKLYAAILSIPDAVVGAYLIVLIVLLFVHGLRLVFEDGLDFEKGFIVGLSFWLGIGFQQKAIFTNSIPSWAEVFFANGMTIGTILVLVMIAILNLKRGRKKILNTLFDEQSIPEVKRFLNQYVQQNNWDDSVNYKLQLAAEETLLDLLELRKDQSKSKRRKLHIELRKLEEMIELDIAVAGVEDNMEDRIAEVNNADNLSINMLSSQLIHAVTEDVRHYQFHGVDYICLQVSNIGRETDATQYL